MMLYSTQHLRRIACYSLYYSQYGGTMMKTDKETRKKLRLIEQIDQALTLLDRPPSLYDSIANTLSVMQLQSIKGELFDELYYMQQEEECDTK